MSATNSTANINLPLFIGTDKPTWLTDWNGAMNAIDAAIANLQTAESGTATSLAALAQSLEALSGTVGQHTTALQTLTTAVSGNTGSINTINSLIGNGQPTTTDKTLIGAINEINAKIPEGGEVAADDVTYDNTDSGLTATDVQAAIDELKDDIDNISDYREIATGTGATLGDKLSSVKSAYDSLSADDKVNAALIINDNLILRATGINNFVFSVVYGSTSSIIAEMARMISDVPTVFTDTIDVNGFTSSDISSNTTQTLKLVVL